MNNVFSEIEQLISKALVDLNIDSTDKYIIERPADSSNGDFASNVAMKLFPHAKAFTKSPKEFAEKIVDSISKNLNSKNIDKVQVAGPGFINFYLSNFAYVGEIENIIQAGEMYGSGLSKNENIIVEYSSPNIAKPFTIGHFRSTIIGDALANILEFSGNKVFRDNHLGDWGTQFGNQIYAIKVWGDESKLDVSEFPVKDLVDLYVKFHKEAENDIDIEQGGRDWFKKLEDNDPEAKRLWRKCIAWSWKEFDKIYKILGVSFTENNGHGYGESYFEGDLKSIIAELRDKNLAVTSEGSLIINFPGDELPPLMVLKSDGATLYATRDLATDRFRLKKYGEDIKIINEVGAEQSLYFKQLYEAERLLGWFKPGKRYHKAHGLIQLKDGKMSTRKGRVIWLETVLEEAIARAREIILKNKKDYSDEESALISEIVGIGALKWNDLKRQSHLDIVFDWDEIIMLDGNSSPYIQYTYVRAVSLLKMKNDLLEVDTKVASNLIGNELSLIKILTRFPEVVKRSADDYSPHYICTYLFELAQEFNRFYKNNKIIGSSDEAYLLQIVAATSIVIENGLKLLGIKVLDKM